MARITKQIVLQEDGKNFHFVIEQMPATRGFLFGAKVAKFLCSNTNAGEIGSTLDEAVMRLVGGMDIEALEKLMDEVLITATYKDGVAPTPCTRERLDEVLTDPANVLKLLQECLKVNLSFIVGALPAGLKEKILGLLQQIMAALNSSNSPMGEK